MVSVVACCKASYSPESARKYGTASVVFSVISIVVVVMLVIFVLLASFVFHLEFVQEWMDRFTVRNLTIENASIKILQIMSVHF